MTARIIPALALYLVTFVSLAHEADVPSSIEHHTLDRVSEHVYVVHGPQTLPNADSRGFMNNPAAILTGEGVIIVDPGSSKEIGQQLLEKVSQVSDKSVIAVFNTHVHGDHWLGNQGIRAAYPEVPIYAHERMIERVETGEGEDWIELLTGMTGGAIEGTKVVGPGIGLRGGETLNLDGISLRIHHTGHAHTDHDLMIEVVDDKVLFFGDIVASQRVPNSDVPQDANFRGTMTAIRTMLEAPVSLYIPGHGRSGGQEVPSASLRFLGELMALVSKYYEEGLTDYEMKEKVIQELSEFSDWYNFNELGRVISFVYQEVERENF